MFFKKDNLIKQGIAEELAEQLEKQATEYLEGFIPRARFNEVNNLKNEYQKQIEELDQQLEELKKLGEGHEELQNKLQELQEQNAKIREEYEAKLIERQRDHDLFIALTNAKAKNPKAVKALIDFDKVKYEDGKFYGLEEQLKELQEKESYLFEEEIPTGTGMGEQSKTEEEKTFTKEMAQKIRQGIF